MTLDLAAIDRELDALATSLDLGAWRAPLGVSSQLDAVDAELAALESGVHLVAPERPPPRVERQPAPRAPLAVEVAPAVVESPVVEEAPTAQLAPAAELAPSIELALPVEPTPAAELALPEEGMPAAEAPLSEDALFGGEPAFLEPATQEQGGFEFEDLGQGVTVSPELAAMLEGELDPNEFGPPRSRRASEPAVEVEEGVEVSIEEGELDVLVDDGDFDEALDGSEPLPATDTSPGVRSEAPATPSQRPATPESQPPEGGEKKGFFKKIFGK
jgi:hypothetical protein